MNIGLFLCLSLSTISVRAFELHRVILAVDTNPMYLDFWPITARIWQRVTGLRPTLAFIAPAGIPIDTSVGDVVRFDPIPGVPTPLHAQVIRLLMPALFPNDGCLISDIEMVPFRKSYFIDSAAPYPDNTFVVYRDRAASDDQYPMPYLAAQGCTFGEIFGVRTLDDIPRIVREWSNKKFGWFSDQIILRQYLDAWHAQTGRMVKLGHDVTCRIDRSNWQYNKDLLCAGFYIDAHFPRPYFTYKKEIDTLLKDLEEIHGTGLLHE